MAEDKQTPMMKQYLAARRELPPRTILLFRLGDFYEMFGEDAKEASAILNVALTKRGEMPMCGVPSHSARGYIEKLVKSGWRVALCDQVGEVQAGKLVRRELTQVLSAGTLDDFGLDDRKPNYLAAICQRKDGIGLAYCELSTGEFRVAELPDLAAVLNELARVSPAETIAPSHQEEFFRGVAGVNFLDGYIFEPEPAAEVLLEHFKVHSLDGFGVAEMRAAVGAAGALLHYLTRQMRRSVSHLRRLQSYQTSQYLVLDAVTQAHLDLVESRGGRGMTLLGVLDRAVTPMGARMIREWILHPLRDVESIVARQQAIARLLEDSIQLGKLREHLGSIRDLERAASRLNGSSGNARDLAALGASLSLVPAVADAARAIGSPLIDSLAERLSPLPELVESIARAVVDEPPALLREGGFVRDGFDPALDELRSASREGKDWIANLQEREITRTGIKSLKVRFTSVFGYFIEITKANLPSVPEDYVRKQTTVNGERFITPELKEIENKILGADERAKAREAEIFQELRALVVGHLAAIQETAASLASLDALGSLAETARQLHYCRPVVDDSGVLEIVEGRHPILDFQSTGERFVPNDTSLDTDGHRFAIITGPNMAGKSTYIRQVALLTLMAQIGSYLPAQSAHVGLVDRIFTRVGASDDLTKGQSTFMVEMNETANILNNATGSSLVILDEIGRGTSTFDGLSIAWSVAEHLHDVIGCRTLFATHYHEITDLERTRSGVLNLNVAVREWNDQVIFLRKILEGRADQSYGIQVARLAGLPDVVLNRAKEILNNLEKAELNAEGEPVIARSRRKKAAIQNGLDQLNLI
ncbi:DNA mismatch repair protein MutS [Terrimicrobium sacchariphilum]|uniref:DNA mismatch repair protein MutS n=1 Tax=Terrimicrobium sacchariphilum TaxID=690879 RepID=A0A146GEC1_TERSA|nr:DNA mismatch repair protein MutS [Terrimicrobium sacchariphilum]GAT35034.1 DNA mismatch repair protein MutS [Terrimicrobium sacchariphilum]